MSRRVVPFGIHLGVRLHVTVSDVSVADDEVGFRPGAFVFEDVA